MDNVKNDDYYIRKIKQDLEFIVLHMKNVDIEELNANELLLDSMLFRMIQLSENAKKLSDEYKKERSHVPWNAIYGLRNRIVHDYGNVDLNIVYETLKNDIPELLVKITQVQKEWSNALCEDRKELDVLGVGAYDEGKSARNAIKSGFRPAWVQMTVKSAEMVADMNK